MKKLNLGVYEIAWISWVKGLIMGALLLLLCSCGVAFQYSALNHAGYADGIYGDKQIVIEIPNDTKIDTITSVNQLRYKLRTDFNFRYNFAQYAMSQPYSFYWNNPRLEGIWRPYNRFDIYFYSNHFWNDWAFNYPFNYGWGWNNWGWNRPWYGWNRPYSPWTNWGSSWYNGPFNNLGYNVVWNSGRRSNIAYINGPRGSRNIQNTINNNKRIRSYPNNNNNIDKIVNNIRENINNNNIIYNRPNNNNIINTKPRINNTPTNNWRPSNNNSRPVYNNISTPTRSTNSTSRSTSSSRGGNSRGKN